MVHKFLWPRHTRGLCGQHNAQPPSGMALGLWTEGSRVRIQVETSGFFPGPGGCPWVNPALMGTWRKLGKSKGGWALCWPHNPLVCRGHRNWWTILHYAPWIRNDLNGNFTFFLLNKIQRQHIVQWHYSILDKQILLKFHKSMFESLKLKHIYTGISYIINHQLM